MVCFGDCRFYHRIAKRVSEELNIDFFVFEEGYVRPNYVTFEQNGVNDFSDFKNFYDRSDKPFLTYRYLITHKMFIQVLLF